MKICLLLPVLVTLLFACKGKSDLTTPEKFVDQLVAAINDRDTALFNDLYVNKSELEELFKQRDKKQALSPEDQQDRDRMLNDLKIQQQEAYENLTKEISKVSTFQINLYEIDDNNEMGITSIHSMDIEIETPDHKKKIISLRQLIKCGDKWKTPSRISVDEAYLN